MAHKVFSAGTAQAVTTDGAYLKYAKLTAAGADATAIIYSNSTPFYYLACKAGTSDSIAGISGGNSMALPTIPGPVTVDVVGVGSHLSLDY